MKPQKVPSEVSGLRVSVGQPASPHSHLSSDERVEPIRPPKRFGSLLSHHPQHKVEASFLASTQQEPETELVEKLLKNKNIVKYLSLEFHLLPTPPPV